MQPEEQAREAAPAINQRPSMCMMGGARGARLLERAVTSQPTPPALEKPAPGLVRPGSRIAAVGGVPAGSAREWHAAARAGAAW